MGLDMYARTLEQPPPKEVDFKLGEEQEHSQIHYWRKHPNLHGWMEDLYYRKGGSAELFNCVTVALTSKDLDELEKSIRGQALPNTAGFFFGDSTGEEVEDDLEFIAKARKAIEKGLFVFYDSWW